MNANNGAGQSVSTDDPERLMEAGTVTSETVNGVTTITFSHPKSNSLPRHLLSDLADTIRAAGGDPATTVIVLQSEGTGAFCGGASFAELQGIRDADDGKRFFMGFATLIITMLRCPKLIITRVHGKAVGGGVGIVGASDYALATDSAAIRLSELAIGLGPFIVGPAIERKIGMGPFSAMTIDADWRDARWAEQHGLYAEVHPDIPSLDASLARRVATLTASNPEAMAQLKAVFWRGTEDWPALLESRAEMSGMLVLSEYTRKAIGRE
ncbi:MAG: enoyl-CoA hydratase/isomerase family protein [Gemmatimonadota bacterium]|nr:enoyl-CoA hydratase/isomerase family protein [Gemmatimonadota bacterium]